MGDGDDRRGRRRDSSIDEAIRRATLELFATGGYGRVTIEAIADAAGVSRPTVYRRYDRKDEAIRDALSTVQSGFPALIYSGDLRADLHRILSELEVVTRERAAMGLVGAVLIEEHRHPDLLHSFRDGVVWPRRRAIAALLTSAQAAGAVRRDIDAMVVTDLIVGSWYAAYTTLPSLGDTWTAPVVDTLLTMLTSANGGPPTEFGNNSSDSS